MVLGREVRKQKGMQKAKNMKLLAQSGGKVMTFKCGGSRHVERERKRERKRERHTHTSAG